MLNKYFYVIPSWMELCIVDQCFLPVVLKERNMPHQVLLAYTFCYYYGGLKAISTYKPAVSGMPFG